MSHAVTSGSADSMNSQLYGAISATDLAEAPATDQPMNVGGEEDDPEIYSEEDVLAGDIITTDEVVACQCAQMNSTIITTLCVVSIAVKVDSYVPLDNLLVCL